jgi:hypothetical protein
MARSRGRARDVRGWLVALSAITGVACGPALAPPTADAPRPIGFPTDTSAYSARLSHYTLTGAPHSRERKADSCFLFWCSKVEVTIQALGNTTDIDPPNAPVDPTPVAHLVNADSHKTEKYYHLLPSAQAEYDLWVNRKPGGGVEWRVIGKLKPSGTLVFGQPTDLQYCHHLRRPGDPAVSDADFAEFKPPCDVRLDVAAASIKSGLSSSIFASVFAHLASWVAEAARSGGGWIDCSRGCCT